METTEKIKFILEEYKMAASENEQYSRLQFQLFSVFFVFTGVAFKLGVEGEIWAFILIQVLIPFFILGANGLEQNIMMNSVYMIFSEKRLNRSVNDRLFFWQQFIGYASTEVKGKGVSFYIAPVLVIILMSVVYVFPVYNLLLSTKDYQPFNILCFEVSLSNLYLILSSLYFIGLASISLIWRKNNIKKINQLTLSETRGELTSKD